MVLEILNNSCAHFLPVTFFEFISNFPVKLKNITFDIQEFLSKKPEKFSKNNNNNKKKKQPLVAGIEPRIHWWTLPTRLPLYSMRPIIH